MKRFEKTEASIQREDAYAKLDPRVLAEPVSRDYETGLHEIAELLTFLPEEAREKTVQNFVRAMLQS